MNAGWTEKPPTKLSWVSQRQPVSLGRYILQYNLAIQKIGSNPAVSRSLSKCFILVFNCGAVINVFLQGFTRNKIFSEEMFDRLPMYK